VEKEEVSYAIDLTGKIEEQGLKEAFVVCEIYYVFLIFEKNVKLIE
jgi:hypothetical protein